MGEGEQKLCYFLVLLSCGRGTRGEGFTIFYVTPVTKQASPTGDTDSDRFCYSGFSSNGAMIASLSLKIPRYQTGIDYEVYTLHGANNLAIQQYAFKRDQITFGKLVGRFVREGLVYKRERDAGKERSPELQECLNSTKPYFKQILSGCDRR